MNKMRSAGGFLVLAGLLVGCATVPTEVGLPVAGVRVLSYSLERAVRTGSLNGESEDKPGLVSTRTEGFDAPLWDALEKGWAAFPDQARTALGLGAWQGPGSPADHPAWVAASVEPLSTFSFDARRARGYYWPDGFRYVDPGTPLAAVALEYPGELFLTVEYRGFTEDVGEKTDFRYPDFRFGLWATFRLYDTHGALLVERQVVGRSGTSVPRRGVQIDRGRFPELFLEAQQDVLKEWARLVKFRTEN